MPMVYFNNGHAFGNKDEDYVLQAGEAFLPEGATVAEISAAFPNYAAGDPTMSPPAIVAQAPMLVAAVLNINVADSDITNIDGMFNIMAVAYADVGSFWLFFSEPQPDENYFAIISGNAPVKIMTNKTTDFFVIETMDAIGGARVDPPQTSVQIYRVA